MASALPTDGSGPVRLNGSKSEKKSKRESKRDKSERSKKRARPDDQDGQLEEEPRKHKKSKKHSNGQLNGDEATPNAQSSFEGEDKEAQKRNKKAKALTNGDAQPAASQTFVDAPSDDGEGANKSKKKHRKNVKSEQRPEQSPARDSQADPPEAPTEPKKKRSKGKDKAAAEAASANPTETSLETRKDKKSKKHSKSKKRAGDGDEDPATNDLGAEGAKDRQKAGDKKSKKEKKKHRKDSEPSENHDSLPAGEPLGSEMTSKKRSKAGKSKLSPDLSDSEADEAVDAMDIDSPKATTAPVAASTLTEGTVFPFFTQTVSLYVPFYPVGFDKPITNVTGQHLDPLLNHYSPLFRGVLLGYRNVNLSERPVRANPNNPPTDQTGALLTSVDEYAVGFGWMTADLDLFIPRRGAWMEGTVNLQSEGHIGVVCWDKFNASIEAKRLPRGWRWVDLTDNKGRANGKAAEDNTLLSPKSDSEAEEEDALDGAELEVAQMHTTGYWVDSDNGQRMGGKMRFRIKNFDVGLAGDYGYLSIEGTMLGEDEERALTAAEREAEQKRRQRQSSTGLLRPVSRRVPEFSMTRLGKEEEEEDSGKRIELYKGSRPGTPDD